MESPPRLGLGTICIVSFMESNSLSIEESPLWVSRRGVRLGQVDRGGEKMESPPRLGLGTIYIMSFMEGLIILLEHVSRV